MGVELKTYRMYEWKGVTMSIPPVFQPFIAATARAFSYLENDYDFRLRTQRAVGTEAWVTYENPTTRVIVHYELGAEPWVEIGRLEMRDGRVTQPSSIGLDLLRRERGEPLDDEMKVPRDIDELEMSAMVSLHANGLRASADDLLRGDFRSFPKLQTKTERELQRREAALFKPDA